MHPRILDWSAKPATFKVYADAPVVPLPPPETAGWPGATIVPEESLWFALSHRRSVRQFAPDPLLLEALSQLLWAANGITRRAPNHLYRTAPSAGGLYPIETYVIANNVVGLSPGIYHYRLVGVSPGGELLPSTGHALEELARGEFGRLASRAALDQGMVAQAPAVLVWSAVFARSRWKYRERAFRYVYLDAGHIAAQVSLAAVTLGLGSCQVAAFFDEEMDALLGLDGVDESTVYLSAVGAPQG
jgi:SagB-type dehydrogenase family enzyme